MTDPVNPEFLDNLKSAWRQLVAVRNASVEGSYRPIETSIEAARASFRTSVLAPRGEAHAFT
jgi:hypothetical protein